MDKWNIIIQRGATYEQSVTIEGVADIANATEWRLIMAFSGQPPFFTASTINGMIVDGTTPATKTIIIPPTETDEMELGNARYDFEVLFPGTVVRRYVSNGSVQINPEAGA